MKKKAISLLLVAAMTATMTAGCGDKQEAADNTTAGNDAAPSTEAAASDDAATEEEEAWSGTLTVWSPQEDQDTGWLQKETQLLVTNSLAVQLNTQMKQLNSKVKLIHLSV